MPRKAFKGGKNKRASGAFLALPHSVLNSKAYLGLTVYGKALLVDLAGQFKGDNNGDLCAAWKLMKPRGWRSEETLAKAKRELLASGLIVETRVGARPNKASLYAITWQALDHCDGKLDMQPREYQFGKWRQFEGVPFPPPRLTLKNTPLNTATVVEGHA